MGVKELLEQTFQRPADLVIADALKPQLRDRILQETVYAEGLYYPGMKDTHTNPKR